MLTASFPGAHFTPIPAGSSPQKRDLVSYIRCVTLEQYSRHDRKLTLTSSPAELV